MMPMMMTRLLGNTGGRVTSGPAADWPVNPDECARIGRTVTRRMRRTAAWSFFSHNDVR